MPKIPYYSPDPSTILEEYNAQPGIEVLYAVESPDISVISIVFDVEGYEGSVKVKRATMQQAREAAIKFVQRIL